MFFGNIGLAKIKSWVKISSYRDALVWFSFGSCSHSVLSSPFSGSGLVLWLVGLVDVGNLWNQRIIWVGIGQQGTDGEENLGDGECWRPLFLQDIKANRSIGVNIWVVDSCGEVDLGWFEWVVSWEVDVQEVNTTGIRWIIWSHDGSLPVILILLINWSGGAVGWWILSKIDEFFLNSLDGRHCIWLIY